MKLVVGLGNPGKEYEKTRHNVGFMIVDSYLGKVEWKKESDAYTYEINFEGEKVLFVKPLTFMNLSGNAVGRIARYYHIDANDILVIHDDMDMPALTHRFKYASSAGGHNGIKSIISSLGTQDFSRLKVGIGRNQDLLTRDFVLSKLSKEEIKFIESPLFPEMINVFLRDGIQKAMNMYN